MFEEISGIPLHPLLVHAAVVFVPLQILAAFAYTILPFLRRFMTWVVVTLAIVGPAAAFGAKLSGDAFRRRLVRNHTFGRAILDKVAQHSNYANLAFYGSIALAALTLLLVIVQVARSRRPGTPDAEKPEPTKPGTGSVVLLTVLILAVLGVGGATGYFVFKAGDTGARIVWSGF